MTSGGRRALCVAAALVVGALLPVVASAQIQVPLPGTAVPQFVQPLPTLGSGLPVVTAASYTLSTCEFQARVLPPGTPLAAAANGATWVWGYRVGDTCPASGTPVADSYIGPVVVAKRGTPTEVTYLNRLGDAASTHVLAYARSVDQTLQWADPLNREANTCEELSRVPTDPPLPPCDQPYAGPITIAPHLHGGEVPAMLDGGPDAWWTGTGLYGHGYYSRGGEADATIGKAVYRYPNVQQSAPIWFHDHTLGATRLNVYAGIAGAYVITDPKPWNANYPGNAALPPVTQIVPLVIQDRTFDTNGQLTFDNAGINPEHPFWVPEFFGDVIVVNGRAWPYVDVQAKRYRLLILNGSNARAYTLSFGPDGPPLWVIGNDGGYLDFPVKIEPESRVQNSLLIMPGERYEVIVDFRQYAGRRLVLKNGANAPYPGGDPVDPATTGRIVQFRVGRTTTYDGSFNPEWQLAPVRSSDRIERLTNPRSGRVLPWVTVHKTRRLTLNEFAADGGPVEIMVNNSKYVGSVRPDFRDITTQWNTTWYSELPYEGETEIWEIVNLTEDAHPIHPHLVDFQILNRQSFDVEAYKTSYGALFPGGSYVEGYGPPLDYNCGQGTPGPGVLSSCVLGGNPDVTGFLSGPIAPPAPQEVGWKDTVVAYPGMVTRIAVRFAPTDVPAWAPPSKAAYPFSPDGGHGYVWHCHIIDHEDNEMMRPFSVQAQAAAVRKFVKGIDY